MKILLKSLIIISLGISIFQGCQNTEYSESSNEQSRELKETDNNTMNHFDKVIGEIRNGKIEFVSDVEEIKAHWAKLVNTNSDLNVSYNEIKIFNEKDGYYLVGRDTVNHASSMIKLVLDGENIYEYKYQDEYKRSSEAGFGTTVTCSGCESTGSGSAGECEPMIEPGVGWYCTDCSEGTCVKTTTTTTGGGVSG